MNQWTTRYGCACRVCGARQIKPRHPATYARGPRCRQCHRAGTLRLDQWYHQRANSRRPTCYCDGYHYPHRPASSYCELHPEPASYYLEIED